MSKYIHLKDELEKFFDYHVFMRQRMLYLGSQSQSGEEESGTDHKMFEYFLKGLLLLTSSSETDPIIIYMNNPGGDFYHGMGIFNAITNCKSHVEIICYGSACSMGSIILQAADTRTLSEDCVLMIHDGDDTITGPTKSVEKWAEHGKQTRKRMYEIYHNRMIEKNNKITLKKIESMCTHDKILTAQEAMDIGLADKILGE